MGCFTPEPRDIAAETRETLQAKIDLADPTYQTALKYQDKYDELGAKSWNNQMFGVNGQPGYLAGYQKLAPALAELDRQSQDAQRAADIAAFKKYGPTATQAMLDANPYNRDLLAKLNSFASAGMDDPYSLTAEQQRQVQQASRAASAARGMGGTNSAVADEVLKQYLAGNSEAQRRFGNASQMVGINQSVVGDPFMQLTGRSSGAVNQSLGAAQQGANAATNTYNSYDPFNSYASQLYGQNSAQQSTGMGIAGSILGTAGSLFKGVASGYKDIWGSNQQPKSFWG